MTHMDFLHHAAEIRVAIIDSIAAYMALHGLPFNREEFVSQKQTDLNQTGVEALFHGAGIVPDEPSGS